MMTVNMFMVFNLHTRSIEKLYNDIVIILI